MAKTTKSGLGRGINSLLGDPYERDPHPIRSVEEKKTESSQDQEKNQRKTVEREHITIEPGEIPEYDPILEVPSKPIKKSEPLNTAKASGADKEIKEASSDKKEKKDGQIIRNDEVAIDLVIPNPDQPRTNFNKQELEELASSIEREGLLQPLLVRDLKNGKYQIIAGERRWQACMMLNMKTVPIHIKEADDNKALELALIENIQRTDLNPIEEAYGYRRLMERERMTQADVAQAVSKGRSTIANALRLLELPEEAQQLLFEEKITAGHARAILSIPTKEGRQKLTKKLIEKNMSVREAEQLARLYAGKTNTKEGTSARTAIPQSYKRMAKALKEALNTNVKVKSSQGKNKIEIEFKDEEDLSRLFDGLLASQKK